MSAPSDNLRTLTQAWLALVALTLASLALGRWTTATAWLPLLMAAVIWIKSAVVAHHFIEATHAHPFVRRVVRAFITLAPAALVLVALFGSEIARWLSLD